MNGSEIMSPNRGFTKEQLKLLAKKQLKLEMDSNITIKSIQKWFRFILA